MIINSEYNKDRKVPIKDEMRHYLMESLSINTEQAGSIKSIYDKLLSKLNFQFKVGEFDSVSQAGVKVKPLCFNDFTYMGKPLTINVVCYDFPDAGTHFVLSGTYPDDNYFNSKDGELTLTVKAINGEMVHIENLYGILSHELFHGFQLPKANMPLSPNGIKYNIASSLIGGVNDDTEWDILYCIYSSYKTERDAFLNQLYGELSLLPEDAEYKDYWDVINKSDVMTIIRKYDMFINDKDFYNRKLATVLQLFNLNSYRMKNPEIENILHSKITVRNFYKRIEEARKYYMQKMSHIIAYIAEERGLDLLGFSQIFGK